MDRREVGGIQSIGTREETWNSICKFILADMWCQMIGVRFKKKKKKLSVHNLSVVPAERRLKKRTKKH